MDCLIYYRLLIIWITQTSLQLAMSDKLLSSLSERDIGIDPPEDVVVCADPLEEIVSNVVVIIKGRRGYPRGKEVREVS